MDVASAFHDRCAYTAMALNTPGTVDHFVSVDEDCSLAYEWSNYRYAAAWLNSSKSRLPSSQLLDPFEVEDDWFEILLPSCQMVRTSRCPKRYHKRADTMLVRLHLRDDERVVRYRRQFLAEYESGEMSLALLERKAPLLAAAVRKRDRVRRTPAKA